jgi:hypothetical protein
MECCDNRCFFKPPDGGVHHRHRSALRSVWPRIAIAGNRVLLTTTFNQWRISPAEDAANHV